MLTIILAGALAATAEAQPGDCVRATARALEVSGEPSADVARAVAAACDNSFKIGPAGSLDSAMTLDERKQMSADFRHIAGDNALLFILRLRACRKTSGCALSSVR